MKKPLVGIVVKPLLKKQMTRTLWDRLVINDEFRNLIVKAGGIPIGIMPNKYFGNSDTDNTIERMTESDRNDLLEVINKCDGIILQGGLTSDTYEIEIVKHALENNISIIGICAGFNNIARALSLPLVKKEQLAMNHDVYVSDGTHPIYFNVKHPFYSLFAKESSSDSIIVNSLHIMFLEEKDINERVEVLATSIDKVNGYNVNHVEAFTVKDTKFCLAIKWHPELLLDNPYTLEIFNSFIKSCKI